MRGSRVLGLLALCLLPAACAQILGVEDFSDRPAGSGGLSGSGGISGSGELSGSSGISGSGGSNANAGSGGAAGEATGGFGGADSEVTPCLSDFECKDATLTQCVAGISSDVATCASDALCDASAGKCLTAACETDEQRCNVANLERCKVDLSGFEVVDECESPALCDRELDECLSPACDLGKYRCMGSVLEACSEDRSRFTEVKDCVSTNLCDDLNGKCVAACSPNAYECSGASLLRCESSGQAIKVEATCATAALCNKTAGRCDPPLCAVNEYKCMGTELRICNASRNAFQLSSTCATSALCNEGAGKCETPVCSVGQYQCQGNLLRVCNSGRTAFETSKTCTASELCTVSTTPPKCQTYNELLGGLDGLLYEAPCAEESNAADDCSLIGTNGGYRFNGGALNACVAGRADAVRDHDVGGTAGQKYNVTLHFYGVVGPRNYGTSAVREAGLVRPNTGNPAVPAPWATAPGGNVYTTSDYITYEVRVSDQNGSEVAAYYVNSDTQIGHFTHAISYARTIPVIGGGKIRFRAFSGNCRVIKNCGASGGAPCALKAQTVDITGANPQPAVLSQPGLGRPSLASGQWLLIDVVKVEPQ